MPDVSFKEWVDRKTEESRDSERAHRRQDWFHAYEELIRQICQWLQEAGEGRIRINHDWVERTEYGLGSYSLQTLRIEIGDSHVDVVPMGRNVIAHINPPGSGELRGAGRVDITDGGRKYVLYRTIQDGKDVWYAVDDERYEVTPLSRERLQEILMDLMS